MCESCIFDPPFCVAMWASNGHGHAQGQLCGAREGVKLLGDVWLCGHHYERTYKAVVHEEWIERERLRWARGPDYGGPEWIPDAAEVVYYVRRVSDGLIKIGWTTMLPIRLSHLRVEHGPLQLLLSHRGSLEREREMHAKFARFRVEGEFFRPRAHLMAWILKLRRAQNPDEWVRGTLPMADLEALVYRRKSGHETVTAPKTATKTGSRRSGD